MSETTISVVMPVYNAERYLVQAISSILTQTFPDFELIAVDDGSTDRSPEILRQIASEDERVVVIRQQANSGVSVASNAGIQAARGRFIARMDADDVALPERFARQIAWFETHPETVALGTQFHLVDPDGRMLKKGEVPLEHEEIEGRLLQTQALSICHPSVMVRTESLRKIGGYREQFVSAQDVDLFLRLAEIGRLANLPDVLLDYRQHLSSIGYSKRKAQLKLAWSAARDAAERRGIAFDNPEPKGETVAGNTADVWRKWAWWALAGGNVATCRIYARRALLADPWKLANWRLAAVSVRGY